MALLGSVMLRPDVIHEVVDQIKSDSFYAERHRIIYQTMLDLLNVSTPIDLLSLSNRLREKGELDRVGGASYLSELVNSVPSAANIKHYAEIVEKKFVMRNLIECGEDINRLGYDEGNELEVLLDSAEKRVFEVTNAPTAHRFVMLGDELAGAWERFDKLHQSRDELRGVPTGFPALDETLSGLQKSELVILGARPSVGKTSLALDIARNAALVASRTEDATSIGARAQPAENCPGCSRIMKPCLSRARPTRVSDGTMPVASTTRSTLCLSLRPWPMSSASTTGVSASTDTRAPSSLSACCGAFLVSHAISGLMRSSC